ncbi:MAG TPA: hypothetical protein VGK23_09035 [Methanomassiliicoccales archaeon]
MSKTQNVFGVSSGLVESYIEREEVDGSFRAALESRKQIIVYGSSKQGKTSLLNKQLRPESQLVYQCAPDTEKKDVYASILRHSGVQIMTESSEQTTDSGTVSSKVSTKVKIPIIADLGGGVEATKGGERSKTQEFRTIEYNLNLAADVAELLNEINFNKYIVLENFHYLGQEVQEKLAYDLRIFQELGIRFVILGIWRERNRLIQFNGDLQDRVVEVAVEPWDDHDFHRVIEKGSNILNVDFSEVENKIIDSSFDSIGVLQELCNRSCLCAGVTESSPQKVRILECHLADAIRKKLDDYSSRHLRALESFAESSRRTSDRIPLYIPFYFLIVLLSTDFDKIMDGFKRADIQQAIVRIHHRPEDVRPSDMSNFLNTITKYQIRKQINPPLFDFDVSISTVKIIDSTLYFFLRNSDPKEILEKIGTPSDELSSHLAGLDILVGRN